MRKTTLACDVCEAPAQHTEKFHVLGKAGRVDLCGDHHGQYKSGMSTWLECAGRNSRPRTQPDREKSAEIRAWAKQEGLELSGRGRIPDEIVRKYEAAHAP